jgi:phosphoadenosine phosphosulfate reductase
MIEAVLKEIFAEFSPAALASSLSAEDMVLTDAIARTGLPIEVFVLDTGRLHADTLALISEIRSHYGIAVKVYAPDADAVALYVAQHGRDAFYGDLDLRQRCCEIRKVQPLKRALAGKAAWITGQRRQHSATRSSLNVREHDAIHGLAKFNPLADWTEDQVWDYIRSNGVPYNRLYDQGYRSIGCAPCTRPILPHEDVRAGRWWWESAEKKECGLHPNRGQSPISDQENNGVRPLSGARRHREKEGV